MFGDFLCYAKNLINFIPVERIKIILIKVFGKHHYHGADTHVVRLGKWEYWPMIDYLKI